MNKQYSFLIIGVTVLTLFTFIEASAGPATAPDRPTNLVAYDVAPDQIDLSWSPPTDDGGSPIIAYKIEYYIVGQGSCCTILDPPDTGNTNTFYSHSSLQVDKTYVYQVSAINLAGTSDPSPQAIATTSDDSAPPQNIPPNPPTGLTANDISPTHILLSWNTPAPNNGPFVTGYQIERQTGSGSFTIIEPDTESTSTTYTDSTVTKDTTYTYKVSAINSVGPGNASNEDSATPTDSSAPPEGTDVPNSPKNFKAIAASDTEIGLSWEPPGAYDGPPVTSYKIEFKKSGDLDYSDLETTGAVTNYLHTGLAAGTTYNYKISAINSIGASNTVSSSAVPEHTFVPTNVIAEDVSPTKIDISWKAPSQTYNYPITGYEIEEKIGIGVYDLIKSTTGQETSVSITGLQTDKTYTFRIKARFTVASSDWSEDVSATPTATSGPSFFAPDPPPTLTITNDSPTANTLLWVKPSNDGGKPITGYKIEFKVDAGDWKVLVTDTKSTGTTYTHSSIPSGKEFRYKVYSINSVGTSSVFNSQSITVDQSASVSKLGRPQGLTVTSPSASQVNLAWLAPVDDGGNPITGYKIEYKIDVGNYKIVSADTKTTSTQFEHKGLTDGGTYFYRVYAINSAGTSEPSNAASLIIQSSEPEPDPEPQEKKAPSFIDTSKDAQYYIDRYNNEPAYKDWFATNYPDYTFDEAIALAYPEPEPDPEPVPDPEPEPKPKKQQKPILPFVDQTKDPQYYIDRYNNEETYMEWFDSTFPDYTIEEAVGLVVEEPVESKPILDFVDTSKDPQYYIDRYNNEPAYKDWFDKTYPDYTIEEAVGLGMEDEMSKQCGPGTVLKNGVCVLEKSGGGCLIATAAFGSELSPQVQLLREIRDNSVLSTQSGTSFMTGFNQFYYSFSPTIADWERQNPIFKEAVKLTITPLLTSLSILNYVNIDSEEEILGYGIGIIFLNIGMYFGAPVFAIWWIRNRF